jgi:arabinofuranosyltransferase
MARHLHNTGKMTSSISQCKGADEQVFKQMRDFLKVHGIPWVLFCGVIAVFIACAAYFLPYFCDDAFISLRYAKRLIDGAGLTWTDGERVEGYTDLLWVLLNAGAGAFGADMIWSARAFGILGVSACIYFVSRAPNSKSINIYRLLSGGLLSALTAPFAVWAVGGLEQGFMTGLLASAMFFLFRAFESDKPSPGHFLLPGLLFALLAVTRADGFVLFFSALLGILITSYAQKRILFSVLIFSLFPMLFIGGQTIFRLFYYGEFVPNTAVAKVAFNFVRLTGGFEYVMRAMTILGIPITFAVAGTMASISRAYRHRFLIPWTMLFGWTGYVIFAGGDSFWVFRQMVPSFAIVMMIIAESVFALEQRIQSHKTVGIFGMLLIASIYFLMQSRHENYVGLKNRGHWEWGGYSTGSLLHDAFYNKKPLLAVDAAGALPYWSELPALDMLGLNDKYLPRHPPPTFGTGPLGHELGDGKYILKRRPDIIAFNHASGDPAPNFPSGKQLFKMPGFHDAYRLVMTRGNIGNRALGKLFVKKEGGPISIVRAPNEVVIPGYFFSASTNNPAEPDVEGRLFISIDKSRTGRFDSLRLEKGTWRLVVSKTPVNGINQEVFCRDHILRPTHLNTGAAPMQPPVITLEEEGDIDISIGPSDRAFKLYEVRLIRTDSQFETVRCLSWATPIEVSAEDLSTRKPNATPWNDPSNIQMRSAGVKVSFDKIIFPGEIDVSLDGNDSYSIEYFSANTSLGKSIAGPAQGVYGLNEYHVSPPDPAKDRAVDSVLISPINGDGKYSIGHIFILSQKQ